MNFSKRQYLFAEYLLNRIGFTDKNVLWEYFNKLSSGYNSDAIGELMKEIEIKSKAKNIQDIDFNSESFVSATDLSTFDFCPVSYAISKSFKIESPTNEDKRITGINLHETLRLIKKKLPEGFQERDILDSEVQTNEQIKKIKNCELIFSGHEHHEKKIFLNKAKKYVGQPDYIFKDPSGKYFVVEEKFKYLSNYSSENEYVYEEREKIKKTFYSNHIVQLQSYINYIQEFNLEYGVLIYWFYDFIGDYPKIHSVSLKIIRKNEKQYLLEKTFKNVTNLLNSKILDFEITVHPNKCASCSVNKYCGHKTGNIKKYSIPYDRKDAYLKYVPFPDELKRKEESPKENLT